MNSWMWEQRKERKGVANGIGQKTLHRCEPAVQIPFNTAGGCCGGSLVRRVGCANTKSSGHNAPVIDVASPSRRVRDGIVDASGPGIGVLLAHIRGVVDDEVGQVAADLGGESSRGVKLMAAAIAGATFTRAEGASIRPMVARRASGMYIIGQARFLRRGTRCSDGV